MKYTELFTEYIANNGGAENALPSLFDKVPNVTIDGEVTTFKDAFILNFCEREIGFETEELFALKLESRAKLVLPFYINKLKLNKVNYSKERMNLRLIILLTIFIYAILLTLMMEKSHHSNDPFIGHVLFQKYTIKRKLGEGSFGMIYQGESKDLKVAIKFEKQRPNRSSLLKSESEIMNSLQLRNKKKYNKYSWNS